MISIIIIKDLQSRVNRIIIEGHSGMGKYGKDIVCSAVSALAYTAAGALEIITGTECYAENKGYMDCWIPQGISDEKERDAAVAMMTVYTGLKQIWGSYGKYVKLVEKEAVLNDEG